VNVVGNRHNCCPRGREHIALSCTCVTEHARVDDGVMIEPESWVETGRSYPLAASNCERCSKVLLLQHDEDSSSCSDIRPYILLCVFSNTTLLLHCVQFLSYNNGQNYVEEVHQVISKGGVTNIRRGDGSQANCWYDDPARNPFAFQH
jgi:hypothetical protein